MRGKSRMFTDIIERSAGQVNTRALHLAYGYT